MSVNISIDSSSPLLGYMGVWQFDQSADANLANYSSNTYSSTRESGASVSITVNATAITIYGSKLPINGDFTSSFSPQDGDVSNSTAGSWASEAEYQVPLATWAGDQSLTTLGLSNVPLADTISADRRGLDLDFVMVQTTLGTDADATVYRIPVDDSSPEISYTGSWTANTSDDFYYNSTVHLSKTYGDTMEVKFQGESIGIYGTMNTSHGDYSVALDGGNAAKYQGYWFERQETLLYLATNLAADVEHTIVITNLGSTATDETHFTFDYLVLNGTSVPSLVSSTSTSSSKSSQDAIIGGVIGGIAGLALVAILCLMLWRKSMIAKRQRRRNSMRQSMARYWQSGSSDKGGGNFNRGHRATNSASYLDPSSHSTPYGEFAIEKPAPTHPHPPGFGERDSFAMDDLKGPRELDESARL